MCTYSVDVRAIVYATQLGVGRGIAPGDWDVYSVERGDVSERAEVRCARTVPVDAVDVVDAIALAMEEAGTVDLGIDWRVDGVRLYVLDDHRPVPAPSFRM